MGLSIGFHGQDDDGFDVRIVHYPHGHSTNGTPYWTVNLHQSFACLFDSNQTPYRHARDALSLHLHVRHMRALRDALDGALAAAGVNVGEEAWENRPFAPEEARPASA